MTFFRTLLLTALLATAAATAQAADTPSSIVQARSTSVLAALTSRRDEFRAEPAKLHDFVRGELSQTFDSDYSARLVLGRYSRTATPEQIAKFADALTENLLKRYGDALLDVDPGLEVKIKAETPLREGQIVRVASEIVRKAGAPVPVDYMFRQNGGAWRAFDVIVEGVSYVQTYRNQFDELLRTQSLDDLTAKLARGEITAGK